jgi:hypothetical protein
MVSLTEFTLDWASWVGTLIAAVGAVAIVAMVVIGVRFVAGRTRGRSAWIGDLERRIRVPGMTLAFVIAAWIVCATTAPASLSWWPVLDRLLLIATVLVGAWLLSTLVTFGMERLMQYDSRKDATSPEARRRQTQLTVLNRLAVVLVGVIAVGVVLFSFPEVRAVGTSILASAGVVSIIAGLAAQSTLGNLIAGVQIAFTDAIRVGDVVVIEGEWGRIGEINLGRASAHPAVHVFHVAAGGELDAQIRQDPRHRLHGPRLACSGGCRAREVHGDHRGLGRLGPAFGRHGRHGIGGRARHAAVHGVVGQLGRSVGSAVPRAREDHGLAAAGAP